MRYGRGDPLGGKIDTNSGWLRVVKTRPVSYEWSNQYQTALALAVKLEKTTLALMVGAVNRI
jgi:alkylhydroperoxidase family enzyme